MKYFTYRPAYYVTRVVMRAEFKAVILNISCHYSCRNFINIAKKYCKAFVLIRACNVSFYPLVLSLPCHYFASIFYHFTVLFLLLVKHLANNRILKTIFLVLLVYFQYRRVEHTEIMWTEGHILLHRKINFLNKRKKNSWAIYEQIKEEKNKNRNKKYLVKLTRSCHKLFGIA